jgi:hypothetical protein
LLEPLLGNSPKQEQNVNIFTVFESSRHEVHNFARYFLYICDFGVELSRLEPEDTWTEKQRT